MKTVAFHPEALEELEEQAVFYDQRSEGLGERFTAQVETAAACFRLIATTQSWHLMPLPGSGKSLRIPLCITPLEAKTQL